MRFFTIAASLVAVVAAQYSAAEETCDVAVTVTVTEYVLAFKQPLLLVTAKT